MTLLSETFANLVIWEVSTSQNPTFYNSSLLLRTVPTLEIGFGNLIAYSHKQQQLVDEVVQLLQDHTFNNEPLKTILSLWIDKSQATLQKEKQNLLGNIKPSMKELNSLLEEDIQTCQQQKATNQASSTYLPTLTQLHTDLNLLSSNHLLPLSLSSPSRAWLVCEDTNTDYGSLLTVLSSGEPINLLFVSSSTTDLSPDSKNITPLSPSPRLSSAPPTPSST